MNIRRQTRTPGQEPPGPLNNAMTDSPERVAVSREAHVRGIAKSTLQEKADLAPPVAVDDEAISRVIERDGKRYRVEMPKRGMSEEQMQHGPELRFPKGTPLRDMNKGKEGAKPLYTPCESNEEIDAYVMDVNDEELGRFVNRPVTVEELGLKK